MKFDMSIEINITDGKKIYKLKYISKNIIVEFLADKYKVVLVGSTDNLKYTREFKITITSIVNDSQPPKYITYTKKNMNKDSFLIIDYGETKPSDEDELQFYEDLKKVINTLIKQKLKLEFFNNNDKISLELVNKEDCSFYITHTSEKQLKILLKEINDKMPEIKKRIDFLNTPNDKLLNYNIYNYVIKQSDIVKNLSLSKLEREKALQKAKKALQYSESVVEFVKEFYDKTKSVIENYNIIVPSENRTELYNNIIMVQQQLQNMLQFVQSKVDIIRDVVNQTEIINKENPQPPSQASSSASTPVSSPISTAAAEAAPAAAPLAEPAPTSTITASVAEPVAAPAPATSNPAPNPVPQVSQDEDKEAAAVKASAEVICKKPKIAASLYDYSIIKKFIENIGIKYNNKVIITDVAKDICENLELSISDISSIIKSKYEQSPPLPPQPQPSPAPAPAPAPASAPAPAPAAAATLPNNLYITLSNINNGMDNITLQYTSTLNNYIEYKSVSNTYPNIKVDFIVSNNNIEINLDNNSNVYFGNVNLVNHYNDTDYNNIFNYFIESNNNETIVLTKLFSISSNIITINLTISSALSLIPSPPPSPVKLPYPLPITSALTSSVTSSNGGSKGRIRRNKNNIKNSTKTKKKYTYKYMANRKGRRRTRRNQRGGVFGAPQWTQAVVGSDISQQEMNVQPPGGILTASPHAMDLMRTYAGGRRGGSRGGNVGSVLAQSVVPASLFAANYLYRPRSNKKRSNKKYKSKRRR